MALPRSFQVDRSADSPLTQQIFDHYTDAIRTGGLLFGTRLPSIRDLATHLGVNKISVIGAYERLVDSGLAASRPGSGFFVSWRPTAASTRSLDKASTSGAGAAEKRLLHPSTPASGHGGPLARMPRILMSTWHSPSSLVALGSSHVPAERGLLDELRSVARHVLLDSEKVNLAYEHPQGNAELRERIAAELELRGIPASSGEQVIITTGAMQALNLALDVLTEPGDAVAVEVPAFSLLFPLLAQRRLRVVEMPRDFEGFRIDEEKERGIKRERPKAIIVSPNFHNPLGGTLSPHQRLEVVRLATETGATVLELDVFSGLHFGELVLPPIASLDALHRTVYLGSFSKALAPGLRLGYACANTALISRMVHKKTILDVSSSSLDQALLCEFMVRGHLRKHLARVKDLYRSRRDTLTAMLRKLAPQGSRWTTPEGGLFLWFEFPEGPLPTDVEAVALEKGVSIAPGSLFLPGERPSPGMRLNFAALEPMHTYQALETVFALWRAAGSRRWVGA